MMNIKKWFKKSFLIVVFIFCISIAIKLPLLKEGGLGFFADEGRYRWTLVVNLHQSLKGKNILPYIKSIFDIQARPTYGLLYIPPLFITEITKNEIFGPAYNLLLVSISAILIFLIAKKLYSYKTAFFASFLFLFSMCSSTYIRHMLPYDGGLLIFLLAIYLFLITNSFFLLGIMMGLSFSTYPGNYYYIIPIPLLILIISKDNDLEARVFGVLKFLAGLLLVMFIFEIISLLVNAPSSYLLSNLNLSETINQGDYIPAFIFILKYAFTNDGVWGVLILFMGVIALFNFYKNHKRNNLDSIFIIYAVSIYLVLEIMSFVTHKTVLYGRTVRMFYLFFMVLAAVGLINYLLINKRRGLIFLGVIILLTMVNWLPRYLNYINVIYPQDFYEKAIASNKNNVVINFISPYIESLDDPDKVFTLVYPDEYYLVNTEVLRYYYGGKKINCKKNVILEDDYVLSSYRPYLFEGWPEAMRKSFYNDPPKYQLIYCKE